MYGTEILKLLLKNGINVNAIIDNDLLKIGTLCERRPIISFAEINRDKQNIFIAIHAEKAVNDVKKQILRKYPNTLIYTLTDLFRHSKVVKRLIDY